MKITILNFRSVCIKLFCLSAFSILFSLQVIGGNESRINSYNDSLKSNGILESIFYNFSNQSETFNKNENYFIVLKNNRNCIDCFRSINDFVKELKNNVTAEFITIALIDSTTLDRKRNSYSNKNLMPDFDNYYFQYRNSTTQTIFEIIETNYTPEIILIRNGKVLHVTYPEIFEYQSMNLTAKTQLDIFDFLK